MKRTGKRKAASGKGTAEFSATERATMKERVRELKAERAGKARGERAAWARIAAMPGPDRGMRTRLHAPIKARAGARGQV